MSGPNGVSLGAELEGGFFLLLVPVHRWEMVPRGVVVAQDRNRLAAHRHGTRLIVVLADQIGQDKSDVAPLYSIHAEVVPICQAIAAALILLAWHEAAVLTIPEPLNLAESASLQVFVKR